MEGVHLEKTAVYENPEGQLFKDLTQEEWIAPPLTGGSEPNWDTGNILEELRSPTIHREGDVFWRKAMEELQDANHNLRDLNHHYLEMLGFVTHEFMQPLSVLKAFLTLLQNETIGVLTDSRQKQAVHTMMRNVNSLVHMIQKYLQLSRIESGKMEVSPSWIHPFAECLQPILEDTMRQLETHGMEMVLENEPAFRRAEVWADSNLLRIVFDNLIGNAIKYGRRGGKIWCGFREDGAETLFYVKNEGKGIPKENLEKIFEKFSRLEGELERSQGGTGLGLFNVREIIRKHDGRSWAESEEGKWANILFTIPRGQRAG